MLRPKTADRHEEANATAAALVLHGRDTQPPALVLWAQRVQERQHGKRANRAMLEQLPLPLQPVEP